MLRHRVGAVCIAWVGSLSLSLPTFLQATVSAGRCDVWINSALKIRNGPEKFTSIAQAKSVSQKAFGEFRLFFRQKPASNSFDNAAIWSTALGVQLRERNLRKLRRALATLRTVGAYPSLRSTLWALQFSLCSFKDVLPIKLILCGKRLKANFLLLVPKLSNPKLFALDQSLWVITDANGFEFTNFPANLQANLGS